MGMPGISTVTPDGIMIHDESTSDTLGVRAYRICAMAVIGTGNPHGGTRVAPAGDQGIGGRAYGDRLQCDRRMGRPEGNRVLDQRKIAIRMMIGMGMPRTRSMSERMVGVS